MDCAGVHELGFNPCQDLYDVVNFSLLLLHRLQTATAYLFSWSGISDGLQL